MSDTPRTDARCREIIADAEIAVCDEIHRMADFARQLERELATERSERIALERGNGILKERIAAANAQLERLAEALRLIATLNCRNKDGLRDMVANDSDQATARRKL